MVGKTYNTDNKPFAERGPRLNVVSGRNDSEDVEHNERSDRGNKVDWTSTKLVNQEGEKEVFTQRQSLHTTVDSKLCLGIREADVVHHVLQVIRDKTIAAPLAEETNSSDDDNPLAVAFGLQEVRPVGSVLLFVDGNGSAHFGVFELNKLVVLVSFAVPACEHGQGFFMTVFVAQPTWRLRHEEDEAEDDKGADRLQKRRKTP